MSVEIGALHGVPLNQAEHVQADDAPVIKPADDEAAIPNAVDAKADSAAAAPAPSTTSETNPRANDKSGAVANRVLRHALAPALRRAAADREQAEAGRNYAIGVP
jgi:hypothetical protein